MPTVAGLKLRLARALGLPSSVPLATFDPAAVPRSPHSPALHFADVHVLVTTRIREHAARARRGKFLDVGGDFGKARNLAGPFEYLVLDPVAPDGDGFIRADICS